MPQHPEIEDIMKQHWNWDYYGLVMDIARFKKAFNTLDKIRKGEIDLHEKISEVNAFLEEFNLLDPRSFVFESTSTPPVKA